MIDSSSLKQWKKTAPWSLDVFVKQDLVISRTLIEIYNSPLKEQLLFRGGTALQKIYYKNNPTRYSEDLDFVQMSPGGIGNILDILRTILEPWLGRAKVKIKENGVTLIYVPTKEQLRLKLEINTTERFAHFPPIEVPLEVNCPWFEGQALIKTYSINELLATKLRALYQRKKGRDLFDLSQAIKHLPINVEDIINCFYKYLSFNNLTVSRAEFEQNLLEKKAMRSFREDMLPLLPLGNNFNFDDDLRLVLDIIISKLSGKPWKGSPK